LRYYKFNRETKELIPVGDLLHLNKSELRDWAMDLDASRRVAITEVPGGHVSTVFLGMDHGYSLDNQHVPLLFETLPFLNGRWADEYMQRYSTYAEAIVGHEEIVDELLEPKK
jgi:hypothetical protein